MDALAEAKQLFLDALALQEKGDLEQAEVLYRKALALAPERPSVMNNLAAVLFQLKKYVDAKHLCERLLELNPQNEVAHLNLGNCLVKLNLAEAALNSYDRALAIKPDYADALTNRGNALLKLTRLEEALESHDHALAIKPDSAEAHNNRGNALLELNRPQEALTSYDRALAIQPDRAEAHCNRGKVLWDLRRPEEAIACYERALAIKPDYAEANFNRGNLLLDMGRSEEAAQQYHRAITLNPIYAEAINALGVLKQEQGKLEEAIACFDQALALNEHLADAQYNLAVSRLLLLDFKTGWVGYDARLHGMGSRKSLRTGGASVERYELMPRWQGPGVAQVGEVGIWAEQGIGDQLLYSTLIPELIAAEVPFVYEVDRRLLAVYERSFPNSRFVALAEPPQETLRQASQVLLAGSLPGLFRRSRESFVRQPRRLLDADPDRVAHYRARMEALGSGLKVALSWRSTRAGRLGRSKSVPLMQFAPLLDLERAHYVDMQYGDTQAERQLLEDATGVRLLHFEEVDYYRDLEDVMAILEACDLLITTSNANAHFAGALGKPVWLLYLAERPPFYYWAHDGSHRCLWYPSVEIVSAPHFTEWDSLIKHVADRLARFPAG
jgi:tetratricopeptide (TPR) repeat protein